MSPSLGSPSTFIIEDPPGRIGRSIFEIRARLPSISSPASIHSPTSCLPSPSAGVNDEYANLVRFISTYRDGRRKSTISLGSTAQDDDEPKKSKWKFWQKSGGGIAGEGFVPPEEWLNTDMKQGLSESDLAPRRKKAGWNELATEKENMFLKFLSYFAGPILYGTLDSHAASQAEPVANHLCSHGNCCPHRCRSS